MFAKTAQRLHHDFCAILATSFARAQVALSEHRSLRANASKMQPNRLLQMFETLRTLELCRMLMHSNIKCEMQNEPR